MVWYMVRVHLYHSEFFVALVSGCPVNVVCGAVVWCQTMLNLLLASPARVHDVKSLITPRQLHPEGCAYRGLRIFPPLLFPEAQSWCMVGSCSWVGLGRSWMVEVGLAVLWWDRRKQLKSIDSCKSLWLWRTTNERAELVFRLPWTSHQLNSWVRQDVKCLTDRVSRSLLELKGYNLHLCLYTYISSPPSALSNFKLPIRILIVPNLTKKLKYII